MAEIIITGVGETIILDAPAVLQAAPVGGSDKQVQFNDAGAVAGAVGLEWDKALSELLVDGLLIVLGNIDLGGGFVYGSTGALRLGGAGTPSHGDLPGQTFVAESLEVDGVGWFDSTVWFYGATLIDSAGYLSLRDTARLYLGTGNDYWFVYSPTGTVLELWSTNVGGDVDGLILSVQDGSPDVVFAGDVQAAELNADSLGVRVSNPPASAGATGVTGQIEWDTDFVYVCVATDTWKRTAISTW